MARKSVTFKLKPAFNSNLASSEPCEHMQIFVLRLAEKNFGVFDTVNATSMLPTSAVNWLWQLQSHKITSQMCRHRFYQVFSQLRKVALY